MKYDKVFEEKVNKGKLYAEYKAGLYKHPVNKHFGYTQKHIKEVLKEAKSPR